MHGLNGFKYLSIIIAVATRTTFELKRGVTWKILAAASSGIATLIATYWDIVIDWGLLRWNSRNPWLRDKLLIQNKGVYFVAMVRVNAHFFRCIEVGNRTCVIISFTLCLTVNYGDA